MIRLVGTSDEKAGVTYPLLVDEVYSVGRKQGYITDPDDQSVSRFHADVEVEHPAGNINEPLLTPVLTLTDKGSKFGTFATEENITSKTNVNARERVTLSVGEKVRFGLQWNEYKIDYTPLVVTSSSFKPSAEFKAKILRLGGHFVTEWNGYVTHVVMESLTLTTKAVCALLSAKPIVTPAYFAELLAAFEARKAPPDPKKFLPPVVEKDIMDLSESAFYPTTLRTTLFAGKTFLFCTNKHLKNMVPLIEAGGGIAKLLSDAVDEDVTSGEFIIMGRKLDVADGEKDGRTKSLLDAYRKAKKRWIGDNEIGMAAIHNSIEKHCNPECNISTLLLPIRNTQSQSSSAGSVVLVPETQPMDTTTGNNDTPNVVDETVVEHEDNEQTNNRTAGRSQETRGVKRSAEDSGVTRSSKRLATKPVGRPEFMRKKGDSSSSLQSTSSSTQKANSTKALNSLFNFSDDDDDDEDVAAVPETQPNPTADDGDDGIEIVPDSQVSKVNVVDLKRLQSSASTQESVVARAEYNDGFRVPESPETVDPINVPDAGTDFIETITTSVMNAKTIPLTSKSHGESLDQTHNRKNTKRSQNSRTDSNKNGSTTSEEGPSRKRTREEDEPNTIIEKTKKINLEDKVFKKEDISELSYLPLVKKSLINKNQTLDTSVLGSNGSRENANRPNFKRFHRVEHKFLSPGPDVSILSRRSDNSRKSQKNDDERLGALNDSIRSPLKMKTYDYFPGLTNYKYVSIPPPLDPKPPQNLVDREEDLDEGNSRGRRVRGAQDESPKNSSRNLTKPTKSVNAGSATSSGSSRRASPRKKGAAIKLPTTRTPSPPAVQFDQMDDEEEEDDMWSFKR